jgi:hypothetical protein
LYDWEMVPRSGEYAVIDSATGGIVSPGEARSLPERMLYTIPYIFAVFLGCLGLWMSRKTCRSEIILIGLLYLAWTMVHALVFTYTRYRMPLEPFLLIFAGYGLVRVAAHFRKPAAPG